MAILKILQYPDPRLKRKARPVENVKDPKVQRMIDDMLETLENTESCAGLAATQLDLSDPMAISVVNRLNEDDEIRVLVNPELVEAKGEIIESEGCMSVFPETIACTVKRATAVTVKALDRNGNPIEIKSDSEFLVKVLQHEIDHLNGIIYIDRLSSLKRKMVDKRIAKMRRSGD